jgi:hypothetical protein
MNSKCVDILRSRRGILRVFPPSAIGKRIKHDAVKLDHLPDKCKKNCFFFTMIKISCFPGNKKKELA